jgi:hypothetical protein
VPADSRLTRRWPHTRISMRCPTWVELPSVPRPASQLPRPVEPRYDRTGMTKATGAADTGASRSPCDLAAAGGDHHERIWVLVAALMGTHLAPWSTRWIPKTSALQGVRLLRPTGAQAGAHDVEPANRK